jgi:hypothetical protein
MPRFTITLSLQPPSPPAELDITYHRALHHELIDLSHQRQPPASLSTGLYRLRITVQADSAQLALERARALVAAAAARAQRPLYPEADADVRVTPTPRS